MTVTLRVEIYIGNSKNIKCVTVTDFREDNFCEHQTNGTNLSNAPRTYVHTLYTCTRAEHRKMYAFTKTVGFYHVLH
jgi:hypothetical protein